MKTHFLLILAFSCICCSCKTAPQAEWVSTTFESPWVTQPEVVAVSETSEPDVVVDVTKTARRTLSHARRFLCDGSAGGGASGSFFEGKRCDVKDYFRRQRLV